MHIMNRRTFLQLSGAALIAPAATVLSDTAASAAVSLPATLRIPSIGVNTTVFKGTGQTALRKGVGHWTGSAAPGNRGACIIFGHRTSYGGPFRNLHRVKTGAIITVGTVRYKVIVQPSVIRASEVPNLLDWNPAGRGRGLVLLACSQANGAPTSLSYRIVVRAVAG
jgi:sortase A